MRNSEATGLARFTLLASDTNVLDLARKNLLAAGAIIEERAENLSVSDPWGTGLDITVSA